LDYQDRKRLAEIARLERQHVNQQAVLRRKAEEAAAANNRLKEVLQRQKVVAEERMKKQESADLSGIGARVRVCIVGSCYSRFFVDVLKSRALLT
jgi:kinesin family protein 4/21/27